MREQPEKADYFTEKPVSVKTRRPTTGHYDLKPKQQPISVITG
jgi:hypothetical protein